jgi:hypothetical protein
MYRSPAGRQAPKYIEEEDGSEEEVEAAYVGDEEAEVVTTTEVSDPLGDELAAGVGKHVKADQFENHQQLFIDVDVDASPEQLAANPRLAQFNLKQELYKHFKENLSDKDRANATEDKLVGNISQIVPLNLEVVEHQNTFPYKMELRSPHFLGKTLHRSGNAIWTVMPGTAPTPVGRTVFEPANVFDERMYKKAQMCSLEDINEDIKMTPATKSRGGFATVATGTAAHDRLLKGLENGEWRHVKLTERELTDIWEPPRHARTINVPLGLGESLKQDLRNDLQEVIDRCINLEDFSFTLARADGNSKWNSPQGLHGMLVGSAVDDGQNMPAVMLQRHERAHVRLLFTFRTM